MPSPEDHRSKVRVPAPGTSEIERDRVDEPPRQFTALRDQRRLGWVEKSPGHAGWLATSFDDVSHVLTDPAFSSRINEGPPLPDGRPRPGWFFGMDRSEHARYRRLLTGSLTRQAVARLEPAIDRIVHAQLDALTTSARATDDGRLVADFVEHVAWPVPGLVICELLGIPLEEQAGFEAQVAVFDRRDVSEEEMDAVFEQMWLDMRALTQRKVDEPGDDLLSELSSMSRDGEPLTPDEGASIALSLRLAGQAPVAYVLSMGLWTLLRHSDQMARLRSTGDVETVVEELLRFLPTNNLGVVRQATRDLELGGETISEGDTVFVSVPVANRDPDRWEDAGRFDVSRPVRSHLAFGHGIHRCVGQYLARLEIERVLTATLDRLEDLVVVDEPVMFESPSSYGPERLLVGWRPRAGA